MKNTLERNRMTDYRSLPRRTQRSTKVFFLLFQKYFFVSLRALRGEKVCIILLLLFFAVSCSFGYSGGTGEPNSPYQIADVNDLLQLANDANDYNKCFIMTADIDLDPNLGNPVFTDNVIAPDYTHPFSGVFDGAGHKIKNLTIRDGLFGLFGYNSGEIKNLGLENVNMTSGISFFSEGGGLVGSNSGYINNSYVTGLIATELGEGYNECLGGLVGVNDGHISNCYSKGSVICGDIEEHGLPPHNIGGLVGVNWGYIDNSYSEANVTGGLGNERIGGFVGNSGIGTITDCCSTGNIKGYIGTSYIGGFAGSGDNIVRCFSTGNVSSESSAWGGAWYVGGFVGQGGNISQCFSTGNVSTGGISYGIGGLVGVGGDINECFSTGNVTVGADSRFIGGLIGSGGNVDECFSTGKVSVGSGSYYIGGLMGGSGDDVEECFSTGDVNVGDSSYATGGLIGGNGANWDGVDINNCYSTGNVTCGVYSHEIGGLVGENGKTGSWGYIYNCYSAGTVGAGAGSYNIGGLVGHDEWNDVFRAYFLDTSGPDNGLGTPLPDANMKHESSFVGWDFVGESLNGTQEIWCINEGVDYPKLAWTGICGSVVNCLKANYDNFGLVDFFDFDMFADAWLTENIDISLDDDSDVDIYDLKKFCDCWLKEK